MVRIGQVALSTTDTFILSSEKARLQAEAKAAEEARKKAEAEAAAEAKKKRELEREAARQALIEVRWTNDVWYKILFDSFSSSC